MFQSLKNFLLIYFSAQFIKFIFAGSTSAFVNLSSRFLLHQVLKINSNVSFVVAYFIGLFTAFVLYRRYVFPYSLVPYNTQAVRFLLINFSFFPIAIISFNLLVELFNFIGFGVYSHPFSHILVIGLPALITFLLYKFFAFKN